MKRVSLLALSAALVALSGCVAYPADGYHGRYDDRGGYRGVDPGDRGDRGRYRDWDRNQRGDRDQRGYYGRDGSDPRCDRDRGTQP